MPLFFFDIHNDGLTRDEDGQELPNVEAAQLMAKNSLPSVAADEIREDGDRRSFAVIVKDQAGRPIYAATLSYVGLALA